jgi:hypothetical protein
MTITSSTPSPTDFAAISRAVKGDFDAGAALIAEQGDIEVELANCLLASPLRTLELIDAGGLNPADFTLPDCAAILTGTRQYVAALNEINTALIRQGLAGDELIAGRSTARYRILETCLRAAGWWKDAVGEMDSLVAGRWHAERLIGSMRLADVDLDHIAELIVRHRILSQFVAQHRTGGAQ